MTVTLMRLRIWHLPQSFRIARVAAQAFLPVCLHCSDWLALNSAGLFYGDVMDDENEIVSDLAEDLMSHVMFMVSEGVDPEDVVAAMTAVLLIMTEWRDEADAESAALMRKIAFGGGW